MKQFDLAERRGNAHWVLWFRNIKRGRPWAERFGARLNVANEVVEKALAHKVPNAVEAAYRRTDFFEKRRARSWPIGQYL